MSEHLTSFAGDHDVAASEMASPSRTQAIGVIWLLVTCVGVGLALVMLGMFRTDRMHAVLLFGRLDVLACSILSALPLAMLLAWMLDSINGLLKGFIAFFSWLVASLLMQLAVAICLGNVFGETSLTLWRFAVGASAAFGIAMVVELVPRPASLDKPARVIRSKAAWGWGLVWAAVAVVVPAAYADAVADGVRADLSQSLESQRVAKAFSEARQVGQLKPHWQINGTSIYQLQQQLDEIVNELETEAKKSLANNAPLGQLGRRITVLVQLERSREALPLLQTLTEGETFHPVALDYLGLCYQRLEEPANSLQAYRRASEYWREQDESTQKTNGLSSAFKGIAFAARRLENRAMEEQAYDQLVKIAPSGENHLLLAQCYREHQKTQLAALHANKAIELAPELQSSAESILGTLRMDHFGCFRVPR